jgi:hypothetical protein
MYWCNLILQAITNRKPGQAGEQPGVVLMRFALARWRVFQHDQRIAEHRSGHYAGQIREDLSDPAVIDEFERRFQAAMRRSRQPQKADNGKRRTLVQKEIVNLTDAIASGALRSACEPSVLER